MVNKKLVLIKPDVKYPVKKQGYAGDLGIPLGLLYLSSFVRERNNYDIKVVDIRLKRVLGEEVDLDNEIMNADIVGCGACTAESPGALNVLKRAKGLGKITVMGGIFPTFNSRKVLNTGYVDYIVLGEGEAGLSKLLDALDGKIEIGEVKGIAYMMDGSFRINPDKELIQDLDTLPLPAYDLIPIEKYATFSPAGIYAARGCPMTCKFCTLNELWEYRYRRRSFGNIIEELNTLKNFGFKRVHFKDETITLNKSWCNDLFREIEMANLGMSYKVKSRSNGLEEKLLKQMMAAGVDTIHSGIESISQRTLDGMEKRVKTESIVRFFELVLGNGCMVNPVYMFSWPGENMNDLEENAHFIRKMGQKQGVITYISFITPHPGSQLSTGVRGLQILSKDYSRYTHKQPVAIPISLGPNGLRSMVDYYHKIARDCGMQEVNPAVESAYLEEISSQISQIETPNLKTAFIPLTFQQRGLVKSS